MLRLFCLGGYVTHKRTEKPAGAKYGNKNGVLLIKAVPRTMKQSLNLLFTLFLWGVHVVCPKLFKRALQVAFLFVEVPLLVLVEIATFKNEEISVVLAVLFDLKLFVQVFVHLLHVWQVFDERTQYLLSLRNEAFAVFTFGFYIADTVFDELQRFAVTLDYFSISIINTCYLLILSFKYFT